ncbi:hypothetical protein LSHI6S_00019 [Leifsonia shinshuensis]
MHTSSLRDEVATFASAVRANLADLPAEDVDDLTDGLEADLLEQAEDHDGALSDSDPAQYASELRASAGLPDRISDAKAPSLRARFTQSADRTIAEASRIARSTRFGSWLVDLLVSLRPAWWMFRGWAVYVVGWMLLTGQSRLLPTQVVGWAALIVTVLVSIQWGRGRWLPQRWLKAVRLLGSVLAVIAAPFLMAGVLNMVANSGYSAQADSVPAPVGLNLDGQPVTNIFGFDAEGRPLEQVQLFDQDGKPLVTVGRSSTGADSDYNSGPDNLNIPFAKIGNEYVWNVFPLRQAPLAGNGQVDADKAHDAPLPFQSTTPLSAYKQPALPTPTPTTPAAPAPTPTAAVTQ